MNTGELIRIGIPAALTAGVTALAASYVTFHPKSSFWGTVIARGSDRNGEVALTFDDGPHPTGTAAILDILRDEAVPAAFFVIGRNVQKHPELVRRMHDEGHLIGNHTFDHRGLSFLFGTSYWRDQIDRTDDALEQTVGFRPTLFRPPIGIKTWASMRAAGRRHTTVTWSRRALDGVATTSDRILHRLGPTTRSGDILLLHDGVSPQSRRDPSATVEALRPLILRLQERGLSFVRLDEAVKDARRPDGHPASENRVRNQS